MQAPMWMIGPSGPQQSPLAHASVVATNLAASTRTDRTAAHSARCERARERRARERAQGTRAGGVRGRAVRTHQSRPLDVLDPSRDQHRQRDEEDAAGAVDEAEPAKVVRGADCEAQLVAVDQRDAPAQELHNKCHNKAEQSDGDDDSGLRARAVSVGAETAYVQMAILRA
eukprot:648458-Prymnesium_polylepis.1